MLARAAMIFSLLGVCDDLCVDGTLSVLLALESVPLYLGNPANIEFNHTSNLAPIWEFVFLLYKLSQVIITVHDNKRHWSDIGC